MRIPAGHSRQRHKGWRGRVRLAAEGSSLVEPSERVKQIIDFVRSHPESYASLAVCRRALDRGLERVTPEIVERLANYLQTAPENEVMAYHSIVG